MGKFVGGADHKTIKGIFIRARNTGGGSRFVTGLHLLLRKHHYLEIRRKQLLKCLLDKGCIALGDDVPLKGGGGAENKPVFLQINGNGIIKPGVQRDRGHIGLHKLENFDPNVSGRIHKKQLPPMERSTEKICVKNGEIKDFCPAFPMWKNNGPFSPYYSKKTRRGQEKHSQFYI